MSDLNVHIVTPERQFFSGTADGVRIPGWQGELEVLPGHDILLSLLRGGVASVTSGGKEQKFVLGRGFVEAGPDRVTLLTDSCVPAEQVDKAAAQQELDAANERIATTSPDSTERKAAEEQAELASAKLSV